MQLDDAVERADLADAQAAVKLAEASLERVEHAAHARLRHRRPAYDQVVAQSGDRALAAAVAPRRPCIDQKALKAPFAGVDRHPAHRSRPVSAARHRRRDAAGPAAMRVDFTVPEQQVGRA